MTALAAAEQNSGRSASRRAYFALGLVLAGFACLLGLLAGQLAVADLPGLALATPLLLLPLVVWRWPMVGVYLLFASALLIEQFPYDVGPGQGSPTQMIPMFQGVLPGGIQPADLIVFLTLAVVVLRAARDGRTWSVRSPMAISLGIWLAVAVGHLILGLSRGGGDLVNGVWEIRSTYYLATMFLLASVVIHDERSLQPLLWIVILASALKATIGVLIFFSVRGLSPRPEAVLAHEESFLLGVSVLLTACLWLFGVKGRIRLVATLLLPVVLLGIAVNSRRTAWLILMVGIAIVIVVAFVRLPGVRRSLSVVLLGVAVCLAVYLPVFWDREGVTGQPARAIRSITQPNVRDTSSNEYREIETYNLEWMIANSNGLGTGYGQRITYTGLVDLTEASPVLSYVSHNGVLYLWLRTGLVGIVVFINLLCQAMVSAVRLTSASRSRIAMLGAFVAAAIGAYAAMGVVDMGFYWIRNAIVLGGLLGAVDGLSRSGRSATDPVTARSTEPTAAPPVKG